MRKGLRTSTVRRVIAAAGTVLVATAMPAARASSDVLPLLWQGVVESAGGGAAPGTEVVAYVRPPADRITEASNALVPIARTTTDSSGRYTLRSAHTDLIRTAEDERGWVTVMLSMVGRDGVTMSIDTVAWQPRAGIRARTARDGDDTAGRWITSEAERVVAERANGDFRAAAADADETERERPSVVVLPADDPSGEPRFSAQATPPPMRTSGMCAGPQKAEDIGPQPVQIGELHLNSQWNGQFKYWRASSTSFQVGVRPAGGGWSIGGSVSSLHGTALSHENPVLTENHKFTYYADMVVKRFTWRCNYREEWHSVETVEPVQWTGGMKRTDFGSPPPCNPRYQTSVLPNDVVKRQGGASTTMEGGLVVAGFVGSATSTISDGVEQTWINNLAADRYLCGESAYPSQNTRVQSLA